MSYTFRPAARSQTKPLIGLFGPSGSGKTYSGLMLGRGFVGPTGKLGLIDTESGRGQLYAGIIPGGYDVLTIGEPFNSKSYIEALRAAEEAKLDALVIDSFSLEWNGVGGVLEQAQAEEERTGKPGLHCWKRPKMEHQRLVLRLLQTPLFVICCLRATYKSRQIKNERGKTEIIRDEHATPIQDESFIFELTFNAELRPDHTMFVVKTTPGLETVFATGDMINTQTGERLAEWARGGSPNAATSAVAAVAPASELPQQGAGVTLSQRARDAAMRGSESYKAFWSGLSVAEKTPLFDSGEHDHNKSVAQDFDRDSADDPRLKEHA